MACAPRSTRRPARRADVGEGAARDDVRRAGRVLGRLQVIQSVAPLRLRGARHLFVPVFRSAAPRAAIPSELMCGPVVTVHRSSSNKRGNHACSGDDSGSYAVLDRPSGPASRIERMPKTCRLGAIGKRKVAVKADRWVELSHPSRSSKPWVEIGELILTIVSNRESAANPGHSQARVCRTNRLRCPSVRSERSAACI